MSGGHIAAGSARPQSHLHAADPPASNGPRNDRPAPHRSASAEVRQKISLHRRVFLLRNVAVETGIEPVTPVYWTGALSIELLDQAKLSNLARNVLDEPSGTPPD